MHHLWPWNVHQSVKQRAHTPRHTLTALRLNPAAWTWLCVHCPWNDGASFAAVAVDGGEETSPAGTQHSPMGESISMAGGGAFTRALTGAYKLRGRGNRAGLSSNQTQALLMRKWNWLSDDALPLPFCLAKHKRKKKQNRVKRTLIKEEKLFKHLCIRIVFVSVYWQLLRSLCNLSCNKM